MEKKYPFKFLDSYTQSDTDMFFGRDEEILALYEMVFQNNILLVYGASGTGKTSLIQCGLAGRFKSYDWLALMIRRGTNINASLEKALIDAGGDDLDEEDSQADDSSIKLSGLLRLIKGVYLNSFKPIYLIFDQFEELYILGTKDEQEKFIESVKEILKAEQPVKMIFSIREEYLGHLFEFEKEVPQLLRKKLRVEPMTLDKVTDVIKGINNFKLSNVKIKADEVDVITQGIFERLKGKKKTLTIQLPYLQVFLDKLYIETTKDESRKSDALIEIDVLNRIGDIGDVLRNFLEEQVKGISGKLSLTNKNVTPEIIWKILSPFSTLEGTKEPISKKELGERLRDIDKKLIDEAVESFVNSRILNFSEAVGLYELAHDSLALRIAEKRSDEEISLLEVRRLIKNQVSLKQDARELFSKKQLNFIEPYLHKLNLTEEEDKLITQSKDAIHKIESKEKARRRKITISIAAVTILVIAVLSFFLIEASIAKNNNRMLLSKNYWNNSTSKMAENDYIYALANAAEAVSKIDDRDLAKKILIDIEHQWPLVNLKNILSSSEGSQISAADFSKDGKQIMTVSNDFIIRYWDSSGKQINKTLLKVKPIKKPVNKGSVDDSILVLSPHGNKVLTRDTYNFLRLWSAKTGEEEKYKKLNEHKFKPNSSYVFNQDGTKLCINEWEIGLTIYELNTSENITVSESNYINTVSFSDDGQKILTTDFYGFVKLINLKTGSDSKIDFKIVKHSNYNNPAKEREILPYITPVNSAYFNSNGTKIITSNKDSSVRIWEIWDAVTGIQIGKEMKHKIAVIGANFIPGTTNVFSIDEDFTTRVWDAKTGESLGHAVKIESKSGLIFSQDGKQILTIENGMIFQWDLLQKKHSDNKVLKNKKLMRGIFSPDMKKVAFLTMTDEVILRLYDSAENQLGSDIKFHSTFVNPYTGKPVVIFSNDSKRILTFISPDTSLLWDTETGKQIGSFIHGSFFPESDYQASPIFSSDGKKILTTIDDTMMQIWDAVSGKKTGNSIKHTSHLTKATFSIAGNKILTECIEDTIRTIQIWDAEKGIKTGSDIKYPLNKVDYSYNEMLYSYQDSIAVTAKENYADTAVYAEEEPDNYEVDYSYSPPPANFSHDGKWVLTFFKNKNTPVCQIWNAETGKQIGNNIQYKSAWTPIFSPDGNWILVAVNDSIVHFFDAETGKETGKEFKHGSYEKPPIISSDGNKVITFGKNTGTIQLWNAKTGKEIIAKDAEGNIHRYKHENNNGASPVFSPDGKQFLTADFSGFLRLWNTETGKQIGPAMKYQKNEILGVVFSPDGKKILSNTISYNEQTFIQEFTDLLWDAETGKLIGAGIVNTTNDWVNFSPDSKRILTDGLFSDHQFLNIEVGDLDIDADLLKLQVIMASGYKYDFRINEKISITPEKFREIKAEYNEKAKKHYERCEYPQYNFWKRFNEEEAKKINPEKNTDKIIVSASQFKILPALQIEDTTITAGETGRFLGPNQAITSNNGKYLLAYLEDGDLVIYRKTGMVPIWSTNTYGQPAYKLYMQNDGNLVIYSGKPGAAGDKAIWSTDTWRNNRRASLVLENNGNLVIYNTKNEIVWQSDSIDEIEK